MTDFHFTLEPAEIEPPEPEPPVPAYEFGEPEYLRQLLELMPPGAAWTRHASSVFYKLLSGLAPEFARAQARAKALLAELNPATAVEMLPEYEEINGLPDPCAPPPTTTEDRQAALAARLLDDAGHNPADYVALAEALGHTGTTVHRRPYPPFRAGIGRAGQRIYGNEWAHVFGVAYMTDAIGPSWTTSNAAVVPGAIAPDGGADADTATYSGAGYVARSVTGGPASAQFDVWLRTPSGSATVTLGLYHGAAVLVLAEAHEVDEVWRRYSLRAELNQPDTFTSVRISATSEVVEVWEPQVGLVDDALECRFSQVSQSHTVPEYWAIGAYIESLE